MLNQLLIAYNEWDGSGIDLASCELPPDYSKVSTSFAMSMRDKWAGTSRLVIFTSGEVGLECSIGGSLWYLLEDSGLLTSHRLMRSIAYTYYNDCWGAK